MRRASSLALGQLAAAQAAAAPQPAADGAQPGEGGDGEARADATSQHGGIEGIAQDTVAQIEKRAEPGDEADRLDLDRPVEVADHLFLVRVEAYGKHDLAEEMDAHDVPVVGGGVAEALPGCRGGARDEGDGCDELGEPAPCAQAPDGDPDAAPGVAAHTGHRACCPPAGSAMPPASWPQPPSRSLSRASRRSAAAGPGNTAADGARKTARAVIVTAGPPTRRSPPGQPHTAGR